MILINNVDAGIPAFAATTAALAWGGRDTDARRRVARLGPATAAGLGATIVLVSALTLARAGALPHFDLLLRFSRLFASTGFGLYPLSAIGLHLVIFVTFVAALGVATSLRAQSDEDRTLAGMLAWGAVFGIGAGAYYVGRSTPEDLIALFFPWAFVLALLLVPALRDLGRRSWRPAPVAAVAAVLGFLLMAASLAQTPTPWGQMERLRDGGRAVFAAPSGQRFIAHHTRPGEPAAVLSIFGHRIAANLGIDNVSPYTNVLSMPTVEQFDETIRALRRAGGRKIFLQRNYTTAEMQAMLTDAGFHFAAADAHGATRMWVDDQSTA